MTEKGYRSSRILFPFEYLAKLNKFHGFDNYPILYVYIFYLIISVHAIYIY